MSAASPQRSSADANLPSLTGRTIVVTGAARGVGRAIAESDTGGKVRVGALIVSEFQVGDPTPIERIDVLVNRKRVVEVQPEGKQPMTAAVWRNGARPAPGECLGP